jgi:hypothetical protein
MISNTCVKNSPIPSLLENPSGVAPGAVGVDDLAPPKFFQAPGQLRIGGEQGEVNIMNIIEEGVGVGAMVKHRAAKGGAVFPEIVLLDPEGVICLNSKLGADKGFHALVYHGEKV